MHVSMWFVAWLAISYFLHFLVDLVWQTDAQNKIETDDLPVPPAVTQIKEGEPITH